MGSEENLEGYHNIANTSRRLGMSRRCLIKAVKDNNVRYKRIGRYVLINEEDAIKLRQERSKYISQAPNINKRLLEILVEEKGNSKRIDMICQYMGITPYELQCDPPYFAKLRNRLIGYTKQDLLDYENVEELALLLAHVNEHWLDLGDIEWTFSTGGAGELLEDIADKITIKLSTDNRLRTRPLFRTVYDVLQTARINLRNARYLQIQKVTPHMAPKLKRPANRMDVVANSLWLLINKKQKAVDIGHKAHERYLAKKEKQDVEEREISSDGHGDNRVHGQSPNN